MNVTIMPPVGSSLKASEFSVNSNLCGFFNVYNILAAISAACASGIDTANIIKGIDAMQGVSGRFEKIKLNKNIYAIVDYAHTPDGLENVLKTAKSLLVPGSKLICVFGCGGDRDTKKRKIMGSISASLADFSLITSDNPRSEDPLSIMAMIEEGFKNHGKTVYTIEADRKKAINRALSMAGKNDIVLIAGKGHENYQEFDGKRIHFSDQEVVREWSSN
jgi:UDP-N-acetylmuramoyl-L-alanyl-D-glutamate--2,6-diaminopimelate ligase